MPLLFISVIFPSTPVRAELLSYGEGRTVVGRPLKAYPAKNDESLIEIARKFRVGYNEIVAANQRLDPFVPGNGSAVTIPSAWVLPEAPPEGGIVINLTEMRLYHFFRRSNKDHVATFPIGIGSEGTSTPQGKFSVIEKMVKPAWRVPLSIQREMKADGKPVKKVVPPGPDNPLGSHALRLSLKTVLIHGTNRPFAIGRRASHGCIRLYPEDIPKLFKIITVGTPVMITRQPVKAGVLGGKVYVEVHNDDSMKGLSYFDEAVRLLRAKRLLGLIDTGKLHKAATERKGIPVEISDVGEAAVKPEEP